jgi:hypothetical protein
MVCLYFPFCNRKNRSDDPVWDSGSDNYHLEVISLLSSQFFIIFPCKKEAPEMIGFSGVDDFIISINYTVPGLYCFGLGRDSISASARWISSVGSS